MTTEAQSLNNLPAGVVGVGTDLIRESRLQGSLDRHGERFARRILTEAERLLWQQRRCSVNFLAKQYAAKEALAKALGTGIAKGVGFQQLEVLRNEQGAPYAVLHGAARERLETLGGRRAWISLTDDDQMIQAFAVLSA